MKKFTFIAAFAALALSANAQNSVSPFAEASVTSAVQTFDIVQATDNVVDGLKGAGQAINDWRVNDETSHIWLWEGTLTGGDSSYPGVGFSDLDEGGYVSVTVTPGQGWSGGGYAYDEGGNINTMHWTNDTRFHIAYMSNGPAPVSAAFVIADTQEKAAKIAVGENFVDGDATYIAVGPRSSDDWQGLDISFSELKKYFPSFGITNSTDWNGNMLSFLLGATEGVNLSMDAIYFHTPGDSDGVVGVEADALFLVTNNTVNVANANSIELYDLSGRLVKRVNGTVLGISDLGNGIYVAKAGNAVKKIMK